MSQENQFDNHFKKKIASFSSPIHDGLWEGVVSRQKEKKRRLFIFRLLAAASTLLVVSSLVYLFSTIGVAPQDGLSAPHAELEKQETTVVNPATVKVFKPEVEVAEKMHLNSRKVDVWVPNGSPATPVASITKSVDDTETFSSEQQELIASNKAADIVKNDLNEQGLKPSINDSKELKKRKGFLLQKFNRLPFTYERTKRSYIGLGPAICPSFHYRPGIRWRYEVLGGLLMSDKTLENKHSYTNAYLEAREASESYLYARGAGLRVSLLTGNGMAFRAGIFVHQIADAFDYHKVDEQHMKIINVYDENGQLVGTDTTYQTIYRQVTGKSSYTLIDLPLTIGYEVDSRRWIFGLNATAYVNLRQAHTGLILLPPAEPNNNQFEVESDYPAFKNQLGLSFGASATIGYKLNSSIHLIAEPSVRVITESITKTTYPLNQRHALYGFWLGIRYTGV